MAKTDVPRTEIKTPFGAFEMLRMSLGLRNAAQNFQKFIDSVLRELDFVCACIYDILIVNRSDVGHI